MSFEGVTKVDVDQAKATYEGMLAAVEGRDKVKKEQIQSLTEQFMELDKAYKEIDSLTGKLERKKCSIENLAESQQSRKGAFLQGVTKISLGVVGGAGWVVVSIIGIMVFGFLNMAGPVDIPHKRWRKLGHDLSLTAYKGACCFRNSLMSLEDLQKELKTNNDQLNQLLQQAPALERKANEAKGKFEEIEAIVATLEEAPTGNSRVSTLEKVNVCWYFYFMNRRSDKTLRSEDSLKGLIEVSREREMSLPNEV